MSRNGGLPARRAVVRWAWRLFRREWRQQVMVLTLLTVAVTAAVVGVSAGYHSTPSGTARFGDASQWFKLYAEEDRPLDPRIAQAREWFGTIDVVGHWYLPVPASAETIELRAQDPRGPYSGPMLRLLTGRYPAAPGEAAVTDEVAADLRVRVGGVLTLDGRTWTVVGLVENPGDLRAEFALVAPAQPEPPEEVTVLTAADPARFAEYRAQHGQPVYELRPSYEWVEAAAGVFSVFAVSMLLVCLIAAAGFAVIAQRRLRQLGLLAAVGATPRHLRLVLLAHGAAVGVAASAVGAVAGVLVWFAVTPRFETAAGHRIDWLDLPWWQITAALLLAVLAATAAAWRPARAAARVPITLALSSRPPRPKRVRRSAAAAAVLVVLGIVSLRLVLRNGAADRDALELADVALVVGGTLAIGFALLFVGPLAIRVLAAIGTRLPVAPRLALRDLARHQARSSAALAAISVALAIPTATVVVARVLEQTAAEGNLSDRQLLIWINSPGMRVPDRTPAQLEAIEARVRQYTATLADPTVIPLEIAIDPDETPHADADGVRIGRVPIGVGQQTSPDSFTDPETAPVATPELLRYYGVDPTSIGQATDVLTTQPRSDLLLVSESGGTARSFPRATTERLPNPQFDSLPTTFLTPAALRRNNWKLLRTGWLVESPRPLTDEQLTGAREFALDAGLVVEDRDKRDGLLALRATATAAGAVLALAILAMTVGLIRTEAAGDLRTLTATGATGRIRRTLTSATAGGLALLGGILGIGAAYTVILAGSSRDQFSELARVPVVDLLVIAVGVPLTAAALGWLLAGREPRSLVRVRLE
ncbi:FtsX-like permease family protein [Micromonospora sp. KC606]|uniref:FtsX-like permease family protein n=1 Tax=Micromonospora sp. KC606 TaxID=2530379 RepID=UPI00105163B4|nr:FtsX-like permease family protein [Micromonospora sp. KC606]TDC83823.1 FtsX-like permease family protein [Micromonospora sp. KC606]